VRLKLMNFCAKGL